MRVRLISKGAREQISGGYLYNNYLMSHLRGAGIDVVYHGSPWELNAVRSDDVAIVDSLVVGEIAPRLLELSCRLVLLLHIVPLENDKVTRERGALAALCRQSDIVVTGNETLDILRRALGDDALSATKIEPGVPAHWQVKSTYAPTARSLVMLANYVPGKGFLRALRVMQQLTDLQWTLKVHGNPSLEPRCFAEVCGAVRRLNLSGRVELRGALAHDKVNRCMQETDLLVHFSEHESYSTVTAEAIACGLPVASHRTGNVRDFAKSGLVRYFNGNDTQAAATIRELIEDENAYSELKPAGTLPRRTWNDVGQEFVQLLLKSR